MGQNRYKAAMLPTILCHYYKKGQVPLRSLSQLKFEEALERAQGLEPANTIAFSRTKNWEEYLLERKEIELKIRKRFLDQGGKPILDFPYYFVLGRSESFYEKYEKNLERIELELNHFSNSEISFTYGDSMINEKIASGKWPHAEPKRQPWHGEVFLKPQLEALVRSIGLPSNWEIGKEPYIEAQVWVEFDRSLLKQLLRSI